MKLRTLSLFMCMINVAIFAKDEFTYLFSHGIAATNAQAYGYTKSLQDRSVQNRYIIDNNHHQLKTFDYPDAQDGFIPPDMNDGFNLKKHIKTISYRINRYNTSFAQENEIKTLHTNYSTIQGPVIGIGVSRGASTFITWLGVLKNHDNIRALVLESPFDSMDSIIRNLLGESLYGNDKVRSISHNAIRFVFSQYKQRGPRPVDLAENVKKDLPILIVCSEEDSRVPASSSMALYNKLRETGHENTHLLILKYGAHGKIIQGQDGENYRNATHAFYKKYNLPHNPEYAALGENLIK